MALEALSSTDLFNVIIYDTISASSTLLEQPAFDFCAVVSSQQMGRAEAAAPERRSGSAAAQGRKKRRRRTRSCKNKEEAETQRMTHIAVERNRRRQMNEHLAVLRSLMPQSYVQRGDQASIVGGAIEFVKELERLQQSLEARKLQILLQQQQATLTTTTTNEEADLITSCSTLLSPSSILSQFFPSPQYSCSSQQEQLLNKYTSRTKAAAANVEVTLIETHANLRILSRRIPRQLSKLVTGLHSLSLTILHMNVTTMDPYLVLYSISAKVEEGCQLSSVDDIAGAVHHMLRIIEEEGSCLVPT